MYDFSVVNVPLIHVCVLINHAQDNQPRYYYTATCLRLIHVDAMILCVRVCKKHLCIHGVISYHREVSGGNLPLMLMPIVPDGLIDSFAHL